MSKELIIQTSPEGAEIALLQDKRLIELHHDNVDEDFLVGDIYLGKVRKLIPGLNAAFVDIGHEKDAFLHYHDLGPNLPSLLKFGDSIKKSGQIQTYVDVFRNLPTINKNGKIEDALETGQQIIVQIVKEPISTKGPRLTSEISVPGRFFILIPFSETISFSKKIKTKEERDRLKRIILELKPKNFGLIARTNAEGVSDEELRADFEKLINDWAGIVKALATGKAKLYSEAVKTESILRDILNASFEKITVDNPTIYKRIKTFVQSISPGQEDIVKYYKGDKPVFEALEVDKQIRSLFNKIVNLGGGSYLIVEHTEAMHVIDVNSGSKKGKTANQEDTALKINLEAIDEIARQLRLRDMGGIIVIDFIDVKSAANKKLVYEKMREAMTADRAKHTILQLTKFGLMQITRQRVRPEINMEASEPCEVCNGTGVVPKGVPINEELENRITQMIMEKGLKRLTVKLNPLLQAYFTKGIISRRLKWLLDYRCNVKLIAVEGMLLNQYEFE
ncbi:MAG: Rne/Rng family ribonuclease [Bacteroidetes bacterium]|nr:Rne/Rng family ribonuclease [Bacteroidota bacterium]